MARTKKYSGENFYAELQLLKTKYKRCDKDELELALGKFLYFHPFEWNNIMGGYEEECLSGFKDEDFPVKIKCPTKIKKKKAKKKVGRPKKVK